MRKLVSLLAAAFAASLALAGAAHGALKVGFYDEATTLFRPDDPEGWNTLDELNARVLRLNLYWNRVAKRRPAKPADHTDPAYDWSLYDSAVERARERGIELIFSVFGTPGWANGGKGFRYAPKRLADLRAFSKAAAERYPTVNAWAAWNEPNAPNFLRPQSQKRGGRWVFTSPKIYAGICNAVVAGVNAARPRATVACGVLNPRGKRHPNGRRDSVAPVVFLSRMRIAGARPEAIAHNPYPWSKHIKPLQRVRSRTNVTLGNIDVLVGAVDRLWRGRLPIWITEYAYQTNPPDRRFGVSWKTQAKYLRQAVRYVRRKKRISYFCWFLVKDERAVARWNSGVMTADGRHKRSFAAFRQVAG